MLSVLMSLHTIPASASCASVFARLGTRR
jgi:hypothetical protein